MVSGYPNDLSVDRFAGEGLPRVLVSGMILTSPRRKEKLVTTIDSAANAFGNGNGRDGETGNGTSLIKVGGLFLPADIVEGLVD